MFRLLIVDDERHIVNWLYELFTELPDLELDIYKAFSGGDAIKILDNIKIDIVITDIRMPEMSGLELADKVFENWPNSKVIFLTGYRDFDYVYEAIKHEGVSYILKVEDDEEIIKAVRKSINAIEKDLRSKILLDRATHGETLLKYLMRREFLLNILSGRQVFIKENVDSMTEKEYGMDFNGPFFLLFGRINNIHLERDCLEFSETMLVLEILTRKYLSSMAEFLVADVNKTDILWVMQPKFSDGDQKNPGNTGDIWNRSVKFVGEMLETMQTAFRETLCLEMSLLLFDRDVRYNDIGGTLELLKATADRENCKSDMPVIFSYKDEPANSQQYKNNILSGYEQLKNINILQNFLEQGMKKEFNMLANSLLDYLKKAPDMYHLPSIEIYTSLSLMLMSYVNRYQLAEKPFIQERLNKLSRIEKFNAWEDVSEYVIELADGLFGLQETEREDKINSVVRRLKAFINENINGDLSLVRLAKYVNYNPSYVSRLFKQVTGTNLQDFINDLRIQRARDMLKTSQENIYTIAKEAGFDSSQYFATVFKKRFGMSPKDYRESHCKTGKQIEQ